MVQEGVMNYSLQLYVQKIKKIPTLPVIAQEILRLVNDEMTTVDALEEIVEQDPPIAAKILSVANSAFFGFKHPALTVNEAIVRIGFNNLRNIALGISLMSVLDHERSEQGFDYEKIYRHSVLVGGMATELSKELGLAIASEVFVNGMLHDIGYLVLNRFFPDSFASVLNEFGRGTPLLEAEKVVLNFTHTDVGTWLGEKWRLPESFLDTICYHHTPSQAKTHVQHTAVTHIADYLTIQNTFKITESDPHYPLDNAALEVLNLSKKDLSDLQQKIGDQLVSEDRME